MNVENAIAPDDQAAVDRARTELLRDGLKALDPLLRDISEIDGALSTISEVGDKSSARSAKKLQRQLQKVEPSVTMIGQVKAGKTSLVNAMIGWPDLLPADVNPWTSVVTSIHLSPRAGLGGNRASFRFFDTEEWTRLLDRGGRMGELAGRAGADEEREKVAEQLQAMREKSIRRLGDKFELLMGQEHKYGYFDSELVERYVCLGDDFENDTETSTSQGRFADITKSADLYLQREEFPFDFCVRDTPGVNDTFMMREQITIRAIRESRMCVVVLSAHQALSTVDMALIRLISNLPSREITIFVNRIDELGDPTRQVPEIEASIRKTLKDHQGPSDASILFGSAYWANHALNGDIDKLSEDSRDAMYNWAETALADSEGDMSVEDMVWHLSGVPKLLETVSSRVVEGMGAEAVMRSAKSAMNLLSGVSTGEHLVTMRSTSDEAAPLEKADIPVEIDRIEAECLEMLASEFNTVSNIFETRLSRSHKSFLDRATASLINNLERYGDTDVWHYDATGLRVLLRSAFQVFARNAHSACQKTFLQATQDIRELYLRAFNVPDGAFRLEAPSAPHIPAPVLLGQTIALDLTSSWWSRWWRRRRGYASFATDFADIIKAETDPIVDGLRLEHAASVEKDAEKILREFVAAQREILRGLAAQANTTVDDLQDVGSSRETQARTKALEEARVALERFLGDVGEEGAAA
ncbi:MAG: dynamin family protein [Pseudomonadota bacterium]